MYFSIALGPITKGNGNYNSNSRRKVKVPGASDGSNFSETSYKQTPQEHEALLNAYRDNPNLTPSQRIELGRLAEKSSPRYWDNDKTPRMGGSTPSSSFVKGANLSPNLGIVTLTMKNGRNYSYKLSKDEVAEMINSNSIGSWYNSRVRRTGTRSPVVSSPRSGIAAGGKVSIPSPGSSGIPNSYKAQMSRASKGFSPASRGIGLKGLGLGAAGLIGAAALSKADRDRDTLSKAGYNKRY